MKARRLWIATQFLTTIPVPATQDYSPDELSHSAAWFPLVGLGIGVCVSCIVYVVGAHSGPLGAVLGLTAWVWLTGALHLDALADLTDALAASHRDRDRFFAVLADPHVGAFAVVAVVLALLLKAAALLQLSRGELLALPLIPAWARLGPLAWSRWVPPLAPGRGQLFSTHLRTTGIVVWASVLLAVSALTAPVLCIAPLLLAAWARWLRRRLGGMTGDCLGAGVELTEIGLLVALGLAGQWTLRSQWIAG